MADPALRLRTDLARELGGLVSEWPAIWGLIADTGVDHGSIDNSGKGQQTWASVLRTAERQPPDVLQTLLDHLARAIGDDAVAAKIAEYRRVRTHRAISAECKLLAEQLDTLLRGRQSNDMLELVENALIRLAHVSRSSRERLAAGVPSLSDGPALNPDELRMLSGLTADALEALQRHREAYGLEQGLPRARRDQVDRDRTLVALELRDRMVTRRRELTDALEQLASLRHGFPVRT